MSVIDIKKVEAIIKRAGDIILAYYSQATVSLAVKDGDSIVTEADKKSELFLKKELNQLFPEAAFYAEESGGTLDADYCWVIDPLDGTSNFYKKIPYFCISVAFTYKNEPLYAFVYNPLQQEMFFAQRGKGAYLNGERIVQRKTDEHDIIIAFEYAYAGSQQHREEIAFLSEQARMKKMGVRIVGAAALDQAYVASGRLDGLFFGELSWWDIAAGSLIIIESGCKVTTMQGSNVSPNFSSFVAGNQIGYQFLIDNLKIFNK